MKPENRRKITRLAWRADWTHVGPVWAIVRAVAREIVPAEVDERANLAWQLKLYEDKNRRLGYALHDCWEQLAHGHYDVLQERVRETARDYAGSRNADAWLPEAALLLDLRGRMPKREEQEALGVW